MQTAKRFTGLSRTMKQGAAVWLALAACAVALCLGLAPIARASEAAPSISPIALQASDDAALGDVVSSDFSGIIVPMATSSNLDWYIGHESDSTYTLSTVNQLIGLADIADGTAVNSSGKAIPECDFTGKTIKLGRNIGCIGAELKPIGGAGFSYAFNGTFDGDGKTISYFKITSQTESGIGLFGYVGSAAVIKNVKISDATVSVTLPKTSTKVIMGVGSLVGICYGSIENCSSNAAITISTLVPTTKDNPVTARWIGGLAGFVNGNVTGCGYSGKISASSPADAYDSDNPNVIAYVGGVVGCNGTNNIGSGNHGDISGCSYSGSMTIATTGTGGKDRFGVAVDSHSVDLGGVAGYSIGNIDSCTSTGSIFAPAGDTVGGIVGAWRCESLTGGSSDEIDIGMLAGADELVLSKCSDTATVKADSSIGYLSGAALVGLHAIGGIVGAAGTHTTIISSYNTANIASCRWNKPSPGGIAGQTYGNIEFCYNRGEVRVCVYDTSLKTSAWVYGGGYYGAGIVGMAVTYTDDYNVALSPLPQIYGCFNAGYVRSGGSSYRAGAIAGVNDGVVTACACLEGCVPNYDPTPIVGPNASEDSHGQDLNNSVLSAADLKSSIGIAVLNTRGYADDWANYFVYDSASINGGYPILSWQSTKTNQIDLSTSNVSATLAHNAYYSSGKAPVPTLTVSIDGTALVQNVDYRVEPVDSGSKALAASGYKARIVGIGNYKGTATVQADYGIDKSDLSRCTVFATPLIATIDASQDTLV